MNIVKFAKNRTNEAKENVHKTVKELVEIGKEVLFSAKGVVYEAAKEEVKKTQNGSKSKDLVIKKLGRYYF